MPVNIKILLGAMTAAAVLIFAGFFVSVKDISGLGANLLEILEAGQKQLQAGESATLGNESLKSDIDKDGLPDEEEPFFRTDPLNPDTDGDGFLDGEEIISGHDPIIPGPNDLLSSSNTNLTQKLAVLTVSGLHEGSLKPGNPDYYYNLNFLVSSVLDDAEKNLDGETNLNGLNIKTADSSKSSQENYIKEFSEIYEKFLGLYLIEMNDFEKNLDEIGKSGFGSQKIKNYFNNKAIEFQNIFNQLSTIVVPENWKENHLKFLNLAEELIQINLHIASGENDPIKAMMALNRLFGVMDTLTEITESYAASIQK